MQEFVVYVLYSKKFDKIYIGYTSNLRQRFLSHNFLSNKGYTKKYRPWLVVFIKVFSHKKQAMIFEKCLKSGKGREYIHTKILPLYK